DGNTYSTVVIGSQIWTVENWRSTKYTDGTPISGPSFSNNAWASLSGPAYCWYNWTNDEEFRRKYGALYNWFVVDPENEYKLAPEGWRVPSDNDMCNLLIYLYKYNYTGKALASNGGEWLSTGGNKAVGSNQSANNRLGYTGLPGGL